MRVIKILPCKLLRFESDSARESTSVYTSHSQEEFDNYKRKSVTQCINYLFGNKWHLFNLIVEKLLQENKTNLIEVPQCHEVWFSCHSNPIMMPPSRNRILYIVITPIGRGVAELALLCAFSLLSRLAKLASTSRC